jgi:hypothetical protein
LVCWKAESDIHLYLLRLFVPFQIENELNLEQKLAPIRELPTIQLTLRNFILPLIFAIQTAYCWNCFYKAQFLEYDDNYGLLINGFIISLATLIIVALIWFKKRQLIKDNSIATIIWTIIGSPITFILAALFYENIFGTTLAG